MTCPNCGNNFAGNGACPICGFIEPKTTNRPGNAGGSFCPNCGAPIPVGGTACVNCGMPLAINGRQPQPAAAPAPQRPQRSRLIAAFLGLFFGMFALEDFYLGDKSNGILHLFVSVITGGFGGMIWGFVNAVRILNYSKNTDADGQPLKDIEF